MSLSTFFHRLRLFWLSLLPHRWIKYFPPEFTFRDPMYLPIERVIRSGSRVLLFLYDIKDFRRWKEEMDPSSILAVIAQLKGIFCRQVTKYFREEEIILFQNLWGDDFLLFVEVKSPSSFDEEAWREKGERFGIDVSKHIDEKLPHFPYSIAFHYGMVSLTPQYESIVNMVHDAIYMAHAMAKRRVEPQYHAVRDELSALISGEKIMLMKQPIFFLSGSGLAGYEILVRGPDKSPFHEPINLFQYASDARLLFPLEALVIKRIFHRLHLDGAEDPFTVYVNVTSATLQMNEFYHLLFGLLEQYPEIDPKRIVFEITERESIEHMERFKEVVARFRRLGFRFAVDDAGTGYSSLYVISEILPEVIKVDRSVIQDIDQNLVKESMLQALLFIAAKIGAKVIAEGIEKVEEMELLLKNQVEFGQGFLLGPPRPYMNAAGDRLGMEGFENLYA